MNSALKGNTAMHSSQKAVLFSLLEFNDTFYNLHLSTCITLEARIELLKILVLSVKIKASMISG